MSMTAVRKILAAFFALSASAPAMALNPQPQPPMSYRGFEYVIEARGVDAWRWEVLRRVDGQPPQVVSQGVTHGAHAGAVTAARGAINHLGAAR